MNLTGLSIRCGDSLLADNHYTYDGNGNRLEKQQLSGTTRYAYDALNQLVKAEYPTYGEEMFYDRAGNCTRRRSAGVEEVYAYDAGNHLTKLTRNGEDISFQYDRAGNLVKDDKASYTYDAFNRNTRVETFDGNIQINRYDAEGLRAEMEENGRLAAFIFNPAKEVVTEIEDRTVLRYIRGSELIARNTDAVRTYYHYASDEMGSITHVTDEKGKLLNHYEYDAWGNLTLEDEQVSNRFKYMGEQFDPVTQQYYLRARFYNPALARFMQEDTYRGDGLNLYAYCANNPVCYVDPSGHWCEKKADIYKDLVEKNGLDINNIDPDTRQRLMAEAANEARRRRKAASSEGKHTPRLPGPVITGQNRLPGPVADTPDDGGRGESGSNPKNVFPENPDDLLPEIPRNKVTKANGTTSQTIQTSDNIRIRAEQHPLLPGETYNPRHHGVHYHVEYKVDPTKSWNNKNNVKKWYPEGYTPGAGSGFIPGETFPE